MIAASSSRLFWSTIVILALQPVVLVAFGLRYAALWAVFVIAYGVAILAIRIPRDYLAGHPSVHLEAAALTCVLMGMLIAFGWLAADRGATWVVALPIILFPLLSLAYARWSRSRRSQRRSRDREGA